MRAATIQGLKDCALHDLQYGCPRTSKKVVRSEVFRKQASTFLIFYSSIRIRDVSGIPSDLGKSKRQGSFLYCSAICFLGSARAPVEARAPR